MLKRTPRREVHTPKARKRSAISDACSFGAHSAPSPARPLRAPMTGSQSTPRLALICRLPEARQLTGTTNWPPARPPWVTSKTALADRAAASGASGCCPWKVHLSWGPASTVLRSPCTENRSTLRPSSTAPTRQAGPRWRPVTGSAPATRDAAAPDLVLALPGIEGARIVDVEMTPGPCTAAQQAQRGRKRLAPQGWVACCLHLARSQSLRAILGAARVVAVTREGARHPPRKARRPAPRPAGASGAPIKARTAAATRGCA